MAANKLANILFVINPISGDIDKDTLIPEIEDFCCQNQINQAFFNTTGENDLQKLADELHKGSFDAVFAVGGDGTVHLVGEAVIHTEILMGIIPMGSGNGLSKDLGIPQNPPEALAVILNYMIRPIDTLAVNNQLSVHITDLGFNALVVKLFSEGLKRGPGTYAFLAMKQYLAYEPRTYKIDTDAGSFSGPAFMVTITNANAFGSNAAINPTGIIDDGKFEICLIEPFPKTKAIELLYRLYHDSIQAADYTRIIRCRRATIYNLSKEVMHIDGEPVNPVEKIDIKIQPKSLRLILPNPLPKTS
jgi:diacylglycerol kinase (ATP)